MKREKATRRQSLSKVQIVGVVAGVLAFGILMEVRSELEQLWMRALVAACAGGALGWALLQVRKGKS
jgi:hypothetical protein